jgi:hypothetical protein
MTVCEKKRGGNRLSSTRAGTFFVGLRGQGESFFLVHPVCERSVPFLQRDGVRGWAGLPSLGLADPNASLKLLLDFITLLRPPPSFPKKERLELEVLEAGDRAECPRLLVATLLPVSMVGC